MSSMLSSDKNVETIAQLIKAMKHYVGLQAEYVKLDVVSKVVRLLTAAILLMLVCFVLIVVVLFASLGLAMWLSKFTGMLLAFLIVAALHAFFLLLFFTFRRPWLERPLMRGLARILMDE